MAWAVSHRDRDSASVRKIKRELGEVVRTIARYEAVRLLAPRGLAFREARRKFAAHANVTVIPAPVDDIWMRDIMPTFAVRGGTAVGVDWNFNGWGDTVARRRRAGDRLAKTAASIFRVPKVTMPFVAEGGALVTDGRGTMITTRSCLLNSNRNPVRSSIDRRRMIDAELRKVGIREVIWLKGDPSEPITSGHADGYVLCAPGGVVLVEVIDEDNVRPRWRQHDIAVLKDACNTDGRKFDIVRVFAPRERYWKGNPKTFAACYLNAYVANGAVIGAKFGDSERDDAAGKALKKAFPGRKIVMMPIDSIANEGGGIHCLTQPMPAIKARAS